MTARPLQIRKASAHELMAVAACALSGFYALLSGGTGDSAILSRTFEDWPLILFNIGMVLGAVITLTGAYLTEQALQAYGRVDLDTGLEIERWGLGISAPMIISYATAVFIDSGTHGLLIGLVGLGIGLAHCARMHRITKDIAQWRAAVLNPAPADPPPLAEGGAS
jgi:hypothetical protein